jgi:16S rRNA (guanine966-N2)-methyltransferase
MRIIAGNFKGKKIFFPEDKKTRPLRDMVKESIFNLIENSNKYDLRIDKSNILDLFSGSGSFGLECMSRGAKKVFFFENYPQTLKVLKKNILDLKLSDKCKIFEKNCLNFYEYENITNEKFDIIFIDPPYKEKNINLLIERVLSKKILSNNGIVIIHRHKKDDVVISDKFQTLDTRSYGISKIIIGH